MVLNKKTLFLTSLVILLVVVGYINSKLVERSNNNISDDYQNYEQELAELNDFNLGDALETSTNASESESVVIVDSNDEDVNELAKETNASIENLITKEENRERVNYYVEYRLSRDKLRASLMENLQFIIDNENSTDEMKNEAQSKVLELVDLAQKELTIEELIKSKGIDDALVFLNNQNARVVVEIEELNAQYVAKILDIVMDQTKLEPKNIKIMKRF